MKGKFISLYFRGNIVIEYYMNFILLDIKNML